MASMLLNNRKLFALTLAGLALAALLAAVAFPSNSSPARATSLGSGSAAGGPSEPDFSIAINIDGMGANECDTSGGPTTCQILTGNMFTVNYYLNEIGSPLGFDALVYYTAYDGVSIQFMDYSNPNAGLWPGCAFRGNGEGPGFVYGACGQGPGAPGNFYTGLVSRAVFTCAADGSITLVHGLPDKTLLATASTYEFLYETADETLTIDCLTPAPYPTDTDGDGCPDTKEAGMNPVQGGLRDFTNPWDYWNPTHDGINRIDDPYLVKTQYFIDEGEPGYNPDTDRTWVGPNPWNLGPPNGLQRIDDMLYALNQYFHDCS